MHDEHSEQQTPEPAAARIFLRPVASSLPLGLFSFGMGTILLSADQLHWVPLRHTGQLFVLMLVFVVPLQLLAGVLAFLARDSDAAASMPTLGATWGGTAVLSLLQPPGARSLALAVFLLAAAAFVLMLGLVAFAGKQVLGVLLTLAAVRYALDGVYDLTGVGAVQTASGCLGVALAVIALYGGTAALLEEMTERSPLPLGRRGRARTAVAGTLSDQLVTVRNEAGVRRQL
ncbi:GPR1/FUN34/YaaH family transporter [Streptomyces sp. 891-h]|uniref:GPR1/FUN34/YaaH family transporter n=1 Tax=unclassified Streptomyces TaxID=2593676 RepID=UPI001FAAA816|nr:GPR1/FUN34/YaaH family transporter [Streptomyces sp. 891-h]UNZ16830.1 hypothetical protein HC362_06865 [Streptomyces sp. 891-h]